MKRIIYVLLLISAAAATASGQIFKVPALNEDTCITFYIANDLGRNGYYDQKAVAEVMGIFAEELDVEFVAALGDVHHFEGVASTSDPLWMTNYELIYSHPELMLPWYPILGNHEYRGNTQAVLDYSNVSRRWEMAGRYYAKELNVNGEESILLVWIDTAPLIDKYRNDTEDYPDAARQDMEAQLKWLEQTLKGSKAKWKMVMGHHPIYADTDKSMKERTDMQTRVLPLLEKYGVDVYACGHIHTFQHIRKDGCATDFIVNASGSLGRDVKPIEGTRFCSPEAGFTIVSASDNILNFYFVNARGDIIYSFSRTK